MEKRGEIQMSESAFSGTILEGRERKYTILNEKDIEKYGDKREVEKMNRAIENVIIDIEIGRVKDGKQPFNSYIVINVDEPYVNEIVEIMKRHGHFR
ncbi:hypothetical protein RJD24_18745 [Bacillaceae bacterium IKA-2]|nr:hypothetical protein RJD24_18745 [Bacillaceae bacterium IKA-2]